ncbi:MAG: TetR family transcriptional regulator [Thiobacillus sp.]|nr:TetR family transcriptional regulator [Thiobacillus sp.]
MVRRTKEDAQETRTLILDTAEQVFREKGVGHTTLAEIAAAAGLTRGAIYWHFDNKAALLQAMNDRVHLPLEAMHQALADVALTDPLAKLRESAHNVLAQVANDPRSRRVFEIFSFKCEFVGDMAEMLERQRESRRDCLGDLEENLRHAVAKGQLPNQLDIPSTAIGIYALVDGLIENWLLDPGSFDLVDTGDRLVANFCLGLAVTR